MAPLAEELNSRTGLREDCGEDALLGPDGAATPQQRHALADSPVDRLLAELSAAWESGQCLRVEDLLDSHPELLGRPQDAVRLIYEEVCLREEHGEKVRPSELFRRFPAWKNELDVLFACHGFFQALPAPVRVPQPGEMLGDFVLTAELGRGAEGCVFLAAQPSLAGRPVVLKLTDREGQEYVSLARLQHTHIVPLYGMEDFPEQGLRALCMPYLGGASLAHILEALKSTPPEQRTGERLLAVLDEFRKDSPVKLPAQGPVRQLLGQASYTQAITWIGVCLAEALHYAHERGLVHLDLKPSNVLLAADGQPLLLDFHLAREPLGPGQPAPEWFGGTRGYMSPEQGEALAAMKKGQPLHVRVDGRSDLYSLGVVLYQALGGPAADEGVPVPLRGSLRQLRSRNPAVTAGLADILKRCLALDPAERYPSGEALAADLRRHLADLPLKGVANRSLSERWQKWQRRSPRALLVGLLFLLLASLTVGAGTYFAGEARRRLTEAKAALDESRHHLQAGEPARALEALERGKARAAGTPGGGKLRLDLEKQQRQAEHALTANQLHALVHRLGFILASDSLAPGQMRGLEKQCGALWQQRQRILQGGASELEQELRNDLLDLAAIWTDLRVRLASPQESQERRREALQILDEAEALLGPSPLLEQERSMHAQALGLKDTARAVEPPRTVWAHYALARPLLRAGRYEEAAAHLEQVREREPQRFWPHFYGGVCAYRLGRHEEAVYSFGICIALSPASAECYYNRGLAHGAQGQPAQALRDYTRALELDANLAAAACNRGLIHYRAGRTSQAEADYSYALARGFETAALHYNLALAQWSRKDRDAALLSLRRAMKLNPEHEEARALLRTLSGQMK